MNALLSSWQTPARPWSTPWTLPNTTATAAAETPIYNINYKDGAVYFDYLKRVAATGIDRRTDDKRPSTDKIYTIDGRCVGTSAEGLPHGIYIRGGKKFVI